MELFYNILYIRLDLFIGFDRVQTYGCYSPSVDKNTEFTNYKLGVRNVQYKRDFISTGLMNF